MKPKLCKKVKKYQIENRLTPTQAGGLCEDYIPSNRFRWKMYYRIFTPIIQIKTFQKNSLN